MGRTVLFVLALVVIVLSGCRKQEGDPIQRTTVDGVLHVHNPAEPLKGRVRLGVREVLRIDSLSIDEEDPPGLQLFARDENDHIYLCDRRTPRMYRFSPDGRLLTSFLKKGEGPGEFPRGVYNFQIINDHIWLTHSRKLVCYTLAGEFVREWKFNRSITFVEMPDDQRLIGNIYENDLTDERKRTCAVFDRSGEVIQKLFEDREAGFTEVRMIHNENTRIMRFFSGPVTNDILHRYDREHHRVYLFLSSRYRIFRKDLQGKTDLVIHREHQNVRLEDEDKMDVISEIFRSWPAERKNRLKEGFPQTFVAFNLIGLLPRGHIGVRRLLDFRKYEFDVFDRQGRFLYILEPPPELPGFYRTDLSANLIWIFKTIEDRDVFILYEMTNLPF